VPEDDPIKRPVFSLSDACPEESGLEERAGERRPFTFLCGVNSLLPSNQ